MATPRLIALVESALTAGGFDGLVVPGECGCLIGDLSPGDCINASCHAGYKHTHSVTGEWMVSTKKEPAGDDEIQRVVDMCG